MNTKQAWGTRAIAMLLLASMLAPIAAPAHAAGQTKWIAPQDDPPAIPPVTYVGDPIDGAGTRATPANRLEWTAAFYAGVQALLLQRLHTIFAIRIAFPARPIGTTSGGASR